MIAAHRLVAALQRLDPASRALLELAARHEMDDEAIAAAAGLPVAELRRRRAEALERLAAELSLDGLHDRRELPAALGELPAACWLGRIPADLPQHLRDERPPGVSGAVAAAIVRFRYLVVAFWVLAAAVLTIQLPSINEAQVGALGDLVPGDADAFQAELRSSELFRFPLLSRTLVVQRDPGGLSALEQARVVRRAAALNLKEYPGLTGVGGALPVLNTLGKPPFSRERSTTAITYLFFPPSIGQAGRSGLARRFVERHIEPQYDGFVGVTGALEARARQAELIEQSLPFVELATIMLVLLVVGLHFRAVGAPLANLAAVGVAYLVSIRLIAWIGERAGVSVPQEIGPVIVVLLFGVVTDYAIFFLSRIRRRMADGDDPRRATVQGTAELLTIIVTAGLTVVAASAALFFADLGFLRAFGPGMAMAILLALLVSISFVPAVLAIGGRWLFWPRRPGAEIGPAQAGESPEAERRPRRSRALRLATTRPAATAAGCVAVLLLAASGLLRLDVGNPLIRGLPSDSPTRVAYQEASKGFAPGILSPTVAVVERRGIARDRRALAALQRQLERQPGVAEVVGPADEPTGGTFGAVVSRTGNAARYFVVFTSDPLGAGAIHTLRRIQLRMPALLERAGLEAKVSFAGDTALSAETIAKTVEDSRRIAPLALSVVFLILVIFLRALVAPLYLVAVSVLGLAAALGLATYVFQDALGYDELAYFVPLAAAVLLVSLGSDYNVFLVGRIWSEMGKRPLREAVAVAGTRASTPITIAGLVLAGSFALLALVPVQPFQTLAFAMAVGLLLDALLVRTLLVPALISLIGHRSGS